LLVLDIGDMENRCRLQDRFAGHGIDPAHSSRSGKSGYLPRHHNECQYRVRCLSLQWGYDDIRHAMDGCAHRSVVW
jgi:hypothetical protein